MTKYEAERLEDIIEIVRDLYDNANIYLNEDDKSEYHQGSIMVCKQILSELKFSSFIPKEK